MIESDVFYDCPLENITVDSENTNYKSDSISVYTGIDNTTLFRVVVSYSGEYTVASYVRTISRICFQKCVNISSIQLHDDLISIGEYAFDKCEILKSILIKGKFTKITMSAFQYCKSLTNIIIPETITDIEGYSFYYCISLTNITFPESLERIGYNSFEACKSLIRITIPGNVSNIEQYAFRSCTSLTSITIPGSVLFIQYDAFWRCTSLKTIIFLNNSNSIRVSNDAFYQSPHPIDIFILGNFNLSYSYSYKAFPERSKLFVTSRTTFSEGCKSYFGEKTMIIYFIDSAKTRDDKTNEVIDFIAIEKIYFKTEQNFIYHQIKCSCLLSLLPRAK